MGRKRKAESFLSCEEDVDDPSESVTSPGELIKYNIDTQTGYFKMDVLGPVAKEKQGRKKAGQSFPQTGGRTFGKTICILAYSFVSGTTIFHERPHFPKICTSQDSKVNIVNAHFSRNFCGRYLVDKVLCGRYLVDIRVFFLVVDIR